MENEVKLSMFADDMILYRGEENDSSTRFLGTFRVQKKVAEYINQHTINSICICKSRHSQE